MENVLIFPNTLFENNKLVGKETKVLLVEHPVFFKEFNYHKMKIVLHRASMKYYETYLRSKYKCNVRKSIYTNKCFHKKYNS